MISWIVAFGIFIGMADTILGDRFGLGRRFRAGFSMLGSMMITMGGILAFAPVVTAILRPLVVPLFGRIGIDPGMLGCLFSSDMGGWHLASSFAEDPGIAYLAGGIISTMLGGAITFVIPMGFSVMEKEDRPFFATGILIGMATIPAGAIVSGLMIGLSPLSLLKNVSFVILLAALIIAGLMFIQEVMLRIMSILARIIEIVGVVGISIGMITYLTGVEIIPGLTSALEIMPMICQLSITLIGMYPILGLVTIAADRFMKRLAEKAGLDTQSFIGIIFTMIGCTPVLMFCKDMAKAGIVLNAAWMVGMTSIFASQLSIIMTMCPHVLPAYFAGKLTSGVLSLAAAWLYTRKSAAFRGCSLEI